MNSLRLFYAANGATKDTTSGKRAPHGCVFIRDHRNTRSSIPSVLPLPHHARCKTSKAHAASPLVMVATTRFGYPPVLVPPFKNLSATRFLAEHFDTQQTLILPTLILRARL